MGIEKCRQDRERKVRVPSLGRFIKPVWKFGLARERAVPPPAIVGDTTDVPERKLQFDQRQRCIDPRAGIYQMFELQSPMPLSLHQDTPPADLEDFRHQFARDMAGRPEL